MIEQEEKVSIPLEDICSIVIEEQAVSVTVAALSKMAEHNIALFTCDQKRLPNGVLQPFQKHSRQVGVLHMQYAYSKPFKKRIWQRVVIQKLINQGKCLEFLNKEGADELYRISKPSTLETAITVKRMEPKSISSIYLAVNLPDEATPW